MLLVEGKEEALLCELEVPRVFCAIINTTKIKVGSRFSDMLNEFMGVKNILLRAVNTKDYQDYLLF